MQRFLSMRATHWDQFKPAPKNFLFVMAVFFVPTALLTCYLNVIGVSFKPHLYYFSVSVIIPHPILFRISSENQLLTYK